MSDPSAAPDPTPAVAVAAVVAAPPGDDPMTAVEALQDEARVADAPVDERPFIMVRDEKFHISAEIPALVQVKMAAAADPRTSGPKQMAAILSFLQCVVVDEEADDFLSLMETARPVFDMGELEKVMTDATEALNGRPTSQ